MATNRFQDELSIKKIGSGAFYTAGKLGSKFKRRGLAGALRTAKGAGRFSYSKNISNKDVEKFHGVVGKRLAKLSKHSEGFSRKTRREIMSEFEQMRKAGQISTEDKKDFRQMVDSLGRQKQRIDTSTSEPQAAMEPKERAINFATDELRSSQPSLDTSQKTIGNIPNQTKVGNKPQKTPRKTASDTIAKRENIDDKNDSKIIELDIG